MYSSFIVRTTYFWKASALLKLVGTFLETHEQRFLLRKQETDNFLHVLSITNKDLLAVHH